MREGGGNCLKYLKRRWNRKEGRGHKDFKRGGEAGSRGGCLKSGGLEPPYELCVHSFESKAARYFVIKIQSRALYTRSLIYHLF